MTFKIALAQCARPTASGDTAPNAENPGTGERVDEHTGEHAGLRAVIESVRAWTMRAADAGADLIVFPEALMTRYDGSPEAFAARAQPVNGTFARSIDEIARESSLWIIYTMNERNLSDGRPFNTAIITDSAGRQRARYRKTHLFDAQGYRESDYMAPGDALMQPVEASFATIGCAICFDLRFPDVSLAAALAGAQVMVYPSAWVSGPRKIEQWETLLAARAIECGMFVAGVSSVDESRIGHSCVFAPDGTPLAIGPDGAEALITAEIDLAVIDRVRSATPTLALMTQN